MRNSSLVRSTQAIHFKVGKQSCHSATKVVKEMLCSGQLKLLSELLRFWVSMRLTVGP